MIRKISSGGYRLYSRKKNPKTGKRRDLGTFKTQAADEQHDAMCSTANGTNGVSSVHFPT